MAVILPETEAFLSPASLSFAEIFESLSPMLFTDFSRSSISLRRPRRLLLFLNAPPDIVPPGFNKSPSIVTILIVWLYFSASAMALSILSTTICRPSRYLTRVLYCASASTSEEAVPITPFCSIMPSACISFPCLILVSGRNVARPYLFFLRYCIISFAVPALSVTIFCILPPSAISMAVSNFFFTLIISATTPIIPVCFSRCSITRFMLCPKPSYLSAMFLREDRREFSIWNCCCISLCSFSRFLMPSSNFITACPYSWFNFFFASIFSETSSRAFCPFSIISLKTAASDLFLITLCVNSAFLILFCSRSVLSLFSSALIPEASLSASIISLRQFSTSCWLSFILSDTAFKAASFSFFASSSFASSSLFVTNCKL